MMQKSVCDKRSLIAVITNMGSTYEVFPEARNIQFQYVLDVEGSNAHTMTFIQHFGPQLNSPAMSYDDDEGENIPSPKSSSRKS